MKTWKELIEALGMAQRKAIGRRMAMISKKKSTQIAKARNKLRPWSKKQVHTKAQKAVRKFIMQKYKTGSCALNLKYFLFRVNEFNKPKQPDL